MQKTPIPVVPMLYVITPSVVTLVPAAVALQEMEYSAAILMNALLEHINVTAMPHVQIHPVAIPVPATLDSQGMEALVQIKTSAIWKHTTAPARRNAITELVHLHVPVILDTLAVEQHVKVIPVMLCRTLGPNSVPYHKTTDSQFL